MAYAGVEVAIAYPTQPAFSMKRSAYAGTDTPASPETRQAVTT